MFLHNLRSPSVDCSVCHGVEPAGCGFRVDGQWVCVVCGAPAVNHAGPLAVLRHTLSVTGSRLHWEIIQAGPVSRYALVRWLHRRR